MTPDALVERRPWPTDPRYLAGEDGSVLGPSGREVGTVNPTTGYVNVSSKSKARGRWIVGAHVIVCEAWHGPRPSGMQAAHGNGVRTDNRPGNLSWKPPPGNQADKLRHGTHGRRLTREQVAAIRASGESRAALAVRYGVSPGTISHVRTGYTWREDYRDSA